MNNLYDAKKLTHYASSLLNCAGLDSEIAQVVAETLVEGDLLGHDTHGLGLLASYIKEIESAGMKKAGSPIVISDKPGVILWDGQRLPGPWLLDQAYKTLAPRARSLGVASLAIKRSHHIACLAVYLMRALQDGYLMVLASSDANSASVAPFGGTQAVFTPNPIAIGFPVEDSGVMIDISASITTNGMTNRKHKAGEKFEHNWLMTSNGEPTNDPSVMFTQPPGTLLGVGGQDHGHKGYGLSLMVEALTAGLAGRGRVDPKEGWGATVHITLYDIRSFCGEAEFKRQMDHVAQLCKSNIPSNPQKPVRLPGQAGFTKRETQLKSGVSLHSSIEPSLKDAQEKYGFKLSDCLIN
jgi:LDH2 family malate/lactate/ureidoglycolate dehydrogenase